MGYSCTMKAGYTLDAIGEVLDAAYPGRTCSNSMPGGGFYECGRERPDGAVTGTVWGPVPGTESVRRRGGFRIGPDGRVSRFPGIPAALLRQAEAAAGARYKAYRGTWQERALAMADGLESGLLMPNPSWDWFQAIVREYQREKRVMFQALPAAEGKAMAAFLREIAAA